MLLTKSSEGCEERFDKEPINDRSMLPANQGSPELSSPIDEAPPFISQGVGGDKKGSSGFSLSKEQTPSSRPLIVCYQPHIALVTVDHQGASTGRTAMI